MSSAFNNLQNSITQNIEFDTALLKDALLFKPESPETFSTFRLALLSKKLDPTRFLAKAAMFAVDVSDIYVRYVGLALRYGADPNVYVKANYPANGKLIELPIHLGKYIWDLTPRSMEDSLEKDLITFGEIDENTSIEGAEARLLTKQRSSLAVLSMMAIKGMMSDAKVTNSKLLRTMGIDPILFRTGRPEFFLSLYGSLMNDGPFGAAFADEIKHYESRKGTLNLVYGRDPDNDLLLLNYAIYLDLPEILTLTDVYGDTENLRQLVYYQDNESLKFIIPRMKKLDLIGKTGAGQKTLELLMFDWCIAYYNHTALKEILNQGVEVDLNTRSQTIGTSKLLCETYPLQCEILNSFLITYVKYGYGLSVPQMNELSFSPNTVSAIRNEYSQPQWKNMCRIVNGDLNPELEVLGRKIGIPIGSNKEQICTTLEALSNGNPSTVKAASSEINRNRLEVLSTNTADVISGRRTLIEPRTLPSISSNGEINTDMSISSSTNPPEGASIAGPICSNQDALGRQIEDYPESDRVAYSDGENTWCFTVDQFRALITTGINPWVINKDDTIGAPIPESIIDDMSDKLTRLESRGLVENPTSMSEGIDQVFRTNMAESQAIYEKESNKRLQDFLIFSEKMGIPRERFSTLSSADYQL